MSARARVCVCVFLCVLQTPLHLLRPGDRGKSVLGVLDGSRGVEPGGGNRAMGQWGMGGMRRKEEEKEEKKNTLGMICY